MAFKGTGKTNVPYLAATILSILVGACCPAIFGICGRILTDRAAGDNVMDGKDIGKFWTVWETLFGLRFKGELTAKGAELISKRISLLIVVGSKTSSCDSSTINSSFRDKSEFLGLPDPDAPFFDDFFDLTTFSGSSNGSAGNFCGFLLVCLTN